jgi:signal transduction histidine kinase
MRLHGGSLSIHSEAGHGTTVNLDFPPERTVPAAAGPEHNLASASTLR